MDFTATWGWPQWALLVLMVLTVLGAAISHGEERKPYNAFISLIDFGIMIFILIAGGFFA